MNKEKGIGILERAKEYRLVGVDEEYLSDFDQWQKDQADTYQRLIDWIDKEVAE